MNRIREFLSNLNRGQRIALAAIVAVVGVGIVALVVVAATGGNDKEVKTVASTTTTTAKPTTTTKPKPVSPLTGLAQPDEARRNRVALIVKIDNDDRFGRPQYGVNQADVVFEETVEGGVTRLAAVFQSQDSDPVGPVRSARTSDLQIAPLLNRPLFAYAGANGGVQAQVGSAPLIDVGAGRNSGDFPRDRSRVAPHNLFTNTSRLFAHAPAGSGPPKPLFQYRARGDKLPSSARGVRQVHIDFRGKVNYNADWQWDAASKTWKRLQLGTPDVDAHGQQINPANVVIQFIQYKDSGFVDVTGATSPEAVLTGSGQVWVLTNGKLVKGKWSRPNLQSPTRYTVGGKPIKLTPGRTWVELPTAGNAHVVG